MADPWNFDGESVPLGPPGTTITLVEGSAFCISEGSGDIRPGTPQGLFFRDSRLLSGLCLRVNGAPPDALAGTSTDPFAAVFVSRSADLLVFRRRYIGRGMREDLTVRNFSEEAAFAAIDLRIEVDFAELFDVKEGRVALDGDRSFEARGSDAVYRVRRSGGIRRGVRIGFPAEEEVRPTDDLVRFEVVIPPHGEWSTCIQVTPIIDDEEIRPRYLCGQPVERATPAERLEKWRRDVPVVTTDHEGMQDAVLRSVDDLGALRIFDPDFPERTVVAAGAPWFMTLFGRDSLITSWMALLVDPDLALGVLQTLARFQGVDVDARNDEEPGRILHEMRFGEAVSLSLGGGSVYYGSADATPLFVMLLAELRRWGLAPEVVDQLLPHADRAMAWIEDFGDRDGDGYVEYRRATDRGLLHQGWKDSHDGIRFADGELARAPVALCEVQGYVYGAYLARAHFADEDGEASVAARYRSKAAALKEAFNRDFWLPERGWFAMALDDRKRPVDALASNMGHCLWTGIVDEDKAAHVAAHLVGPDMFSGWGIRTLGASMVGYNPISYHCGSVWPHDNALIAAGLMRYGHVAEAQRVVLAMLDAASTQGGRLPELFTGLDREEYPTVVSYPTSCSPQAWAAGSPLLFLRTLLRFDPWIPSGKVSVAPAVPASLGRLRVDGIPLAGSRVSVDVDANGSVHVDGLPPDVELVSEPRSPLTA
ncbi:MAG TPA: glycogen debranching N-terminal domain-containing protein [Acidimicrobiales bacterium]|nr:glycogen debranching N-terminal domain-containing protein [Acidimicrobiales bacterium]